MVLRLYNPEYTSEPNPLIRQQPYTLLAIQTEPVANLTLGANLDIQLYPPQSMPPRELLESLVPNDRIFVFGGVNPTGVRHAQSYEYRFYVYGVRPLQSGTLTLTVHDQQLVRTVQDESPPPTQSENLATILSLETAYWGGGRKCHIATIYIPQTPARVRAVDLGGSSILHLQTETPYGYRITVDYINTDARIDIRSLSNPNETNVYATLRVIAWLH